MVEGLVWSRPSLMKVHDHTVVVRRDRAEDASLRDQKVALVSGGGSGHEPAHAGFVGQGLLSGAVAGDVFTSPAPDAILAAIKAVTGSKGCLLIVKNYTGDRLNFGLAAEMARSEGLKVNIVIVADDVALASDDSTAGRRGIAGTVLVHKIAGAAAEEGKSLEEVTQIAQHVAGNVRTMGIALSPCIVPAVGKPTFTLGADEVELGLGIHGEAGVRKQALQSADDTTDQLIAAILSDAKMAANSRVILMVNNLGSTTSMELYIVARRALQRLEEQGFVVDRLLIGTFMTALEMTGVSLTILPASQDLIRLLDSPAAHDAAWHGFSRAAPDRSRAVAPVDAHSSASARPSASSGSVPPSLAVQPSLLADIIKQITESVLKHEDLLTQLDQETGDGDFGVTLARGGQAVKRELQSITSSGSLADSLYSLGMILQRSMGGTSGALYGVFFIRMADSMRTREDLELADSLRIWAEAIQAGTDAIAQLGGAKQGDCTMLDALLPVAQTFMRAAIAERVGWQSTLAEAAEAARKGADTTSELVRRKGRGSFLGERARGHKDAGAEAVALLAAAIRDAFCHTS